MKTVKVRDISGRRVVGTIANGVFYKAVKGSKHKLKFPPAWAIDSHAFDEQLFGKVTKIVIIDEETGQRFTISPLTFHLNKKTLNRGHGKQYFLELEKWNLVDENQLNLF